MKKILVLLILVLLLGTGCFKRDNMEDIGIITTIYPFEFVTNRLYGDNAIVNSIYPDGTNIANEHLKEKQIRDYSKKELFIYNGLSSDKDIAATFIKNNPKIKIIDATFGMEYENSLEELWLNPSHLLMISQNIQTGLKEYITNTYLKKEIDEKYEELKIDLSELDAELKLTIQNSNNRVIVTTSPALLFLEKYGLTVYILNKDDSNYEKNYEIVKGLINSKKILYYYTLEYDDTNTEIRKDLKENYGLQELTFRKVDNLKEEERDNKKDYLDIMKENIDLLKKELHKS